MLTHMGEHSQSQHSVKAHEVGNLQSHAMTLISGVFAKQHFYSQGFLPAQCLKNRMVLTVRVNQVFLDQR